MAVITTQDGRSIEVPQSAVAPGEAIEFDVERYPIIRVVFPVGPVTDEAFEDMFARAVTVLSQSTRVAIIMDMSALAHMPNAAQRARYAEWSKAHAVLHAERIAGTASIVRNGTVRGLVTAINWLRPSPNPRTAVADLDEALTWCNARLG